MEKRKFIIGDKWLYIKIYSGTSMLETLLKSQIFEMVTILSKDSVIDNFFFIRYWDDFGNHLRIRFHLVSTSYLNIIIQLLNKLLREFIDNRVIHKLTIDTYSRELERYGEENIEAIEYIFGMHSWHVLEYLAIQEKSPEKRPLFAIANLNSILHVLGISIYERHRICEISYQAFAKEFSINSLIKNSLKSKYRAIKPTLSDDYFDIISNLHLKPPPFYGLTTYSNAIKKLVNQTTNLNKANSGKWLRLEEICRSLIHMQCNRLFVSKQRQNEFVLCYVLSNHYKSKHVQLNKITTNE
ncbi:MAG: thiopeptide-type bacteriocin biosynthesis protein [Agriterribacter sp.]